MKLITSWDDGSIYDMRMAELLSKYDMPAIFFIPTVNELSIDQIQKLSHDFIIGGHTTTHPLDLKRLSKDQVRYEVSDNRVFLQEVTGQSVDWFCYPRGRYNEETIDVLKEVGFKYARTTLVGNVEMPVNNFRINPTVHVHNARKEYNEVNWLEYAINKLYMAQDYDNGYYHIWGHSWEVEQLGLWNELEKLLRKICHGV